MFCIEFGKFLAIIVSGNTVSCSSLFQRFVRVCTHMHSSVYGIVPQITEILLIFIQSLFSLLFKLDQFYPFIFKFINPFLWYLQYAVKPTTVVINTANVLFISKTFILFIFHFLNEHFPIFLFIMTLFFFKPLNIFLTAVLKSMCANFNIWVNLR